jgi:hypothetical protein
VVVDDEALFRKGGLGTAVGSAPVSPLAGGGDETRRQIVSRAAGQVR